MISVVFTEKRHNLKKILSGVFHPYEKEQVLICMFNQLEFNRIWIGSGYDILMCERPQTTRPPLCSLHHPRTMGR